MRPVSPRTSVVAEWRHLYPGLAPDSEETMGADLKFVPRGNTLIPVPGFRQEHGAQPKRICAAVKGNKWQISPRPHVVQADSRESQLLIRMAQRGDVLPYDEFTASACGVKLEPLEWVDGDQGWLPAVKPTEKRETKRSTKTPDATPEG